MNSAICIEDFEYIVSQALPWKKFANKTILITGSTGFLASYLIEALLYLNQQKKNKITIIGMARDKEKAEKRFIKYKNRSDLKMVIQDDVSNPINIRERVHFVIHTASLSSPKYYNTNPVETLKPNVLGTYNLLEFSRSQPVESFLYISSGEIYGIMQAIGFTNETIYGPLDPIDIRSCYAESKRMGETMCVSWQHQYGTPTKVARLYHTYGPGIPLNDGRVFADFISNILNNENIVMKSDGRATRSFCYIADTITGFLTILLQGEDGKAYNLANENAIVSIKKLAEILVDLFPEKKLKIVFEERQKEDTYMKSKIMINCPDTTKLRSLGWKPHFSLEEGFKRTIESFVSK